MDINEMARQLYTCVVEINRLKSVNKELRGALKSIANGEYCEGEKGEIAIQALKKAGEL